MSIAAIVTRGYGTYARVNSIAKAGYSSYVGLLEPPAAGYQYTSLTLPGGGWDAQAIPYNQSPAVVTGDILITPTTTVPGSYPVTPGADGIVSVDTGGDSSRQILTAVDIYDVSLLALYGSADFAINDQPPTADPIDTQTLRYNQLMTPADLSVAFNDPEFDVITYAITSGSAPTGTSVDSAGQWTGTPSSVSTGSFTLTGTDPYGATGTLVVAWAVIDQVSVPNVVNEDQAVAEADIVAASLVFDETTAYSATVAFGKIISQSPAAATLVDPGSTITLTVSLGEEPITEGGIASRPRKRYYVEIDHQRFEVTSPTHAQALLDRAREVAQTHAQELAQKAVQRKRKPSKKPVPLPTPQISSPNPELKGVIRDAREQINEVYRQAAMQAELALLFAHRLAEEDEEESLLLLM